MSKKVFISYCHAQGEWVWDRLVPCLRAGGAEVHIDRERFTAGKAIIGQMDATQDMAEVNVLVFSPGYLASDYCLHEMDRAIDRDPLFQHGSVIPVKRVDCNLPTTITTPNPLEVDLRDDKNPSQWDALLRACGANLGAAVPDWLEALDTTRQLLQRNQSVNLVVSQNPRWRELIEYLRVESLKDLGIVDLESGATASRQGLVKEILRACGAPSNVPAEPNDLVVLDRTLSTRPLSRLVLKHFDLAHSRSQYGLDFWSALRHLLMDSRKLVLLAQSRTPFAALLPPDHPLSSIDIHTVELKGRP